MQDKIATSVKPLGQEKNPLFPVFLKLEQLSVLLVGGGKVGLEKLQALLGNAPATKIRLVATHISAEVRAIAELHEGLILFEKPFEPSDLEGADVVVIAINDKQVSANIRQLAKVRKLLVNVADTPELCDFYLGSIVQKGNLKIAISTNGKSPTAAKRIKEVLQQALPDQLDAVIDNLHTIRNKLNGNFEYKVKKLNELTQGLVEKDTIDKSNRWRKIATYSLLGFALMLIGHFIFSYLPIQTMADDATTYYKTLDKNFHWMVLAGFLAQLVDGALGMGYGVTSATILLSAGVNLASISGSIHTAEMFASGASGYSHYKFGNVNKKLFKALIIPGVVGAVLGAILLSKFGSTHAQYLRPIMAIYTLFLGIRILVNAFRAQKAQKKFKRHGLLAGVGGFLDSFGGGGWGPIVTTTLITKGRSPRFVIGTVSITEFFVTLASAFTFFTLLGVSHWQVIVALIIGGLLAAPLAAKLTGKLPRKTSFILVGVLVIVWSLKIIWSLF
ncbi:MAG: ABC transporter permease [Chitinophagaceae bacterium]|nr:MAG: ABC transporter permease [Chitinophagaceae bacterium]